MVVGLVFGATCAVLSNIPAANVGEIDQAYFVGGFAGMVLGALGLALLQNSRRRSTTPV
jgi:hypothetical protein